MCKKWAVFCNIRWNLSWETTAMRDHLYWQTTHFFWQKDLHFNIPEPVTGDHLSWQTTFCAQWGGLSRQIPLYNRGIEDAFQLLTSNPGTTTKIDINELKSETYLLQPHGKYSYEQPQTIFQTGAWSKCQINFYFFGQVTYMITSAHIGIWATKILITIWKTNIVVLW